MNKDLTCTQVSALINFYLEGRLNPRLKEYVDVHLTKCPACRKKIEELQKILNKYKTSSSTNVEMNTNFQVDKEFLHKLSAYVDNELNSNENIKIKKMAISNPTARKELETMYKFKKIIHDHIINTTYINQLINLKPPNFFYKSTKNAYWRKDSLTKSVLGNLEFHKKKDGTNSPPLALKNHQHKLGKRSQYST